MSLAYQPYGVFVSNGEVFIADSLNHRIRKVLRNGQIVTIAGTGKRGFNGDDQLATDAQLYGPRAVVVSSSNQVYISDMHNHRIRKIDRNGMISTIAGTGQSGYNGDGQLAVNAQLYHPEGLFVTDDEEVLIADSSNYRVRKIDRFGIITTIAGSGEYGNGNNGDGQLATRASLAYPTGVFQYKHQVYITDSSGNRIRKIDQNGIISTIVERSKHIYAVFVHNDEVYFTSLCLCKILPNGIIKTVEFNNTECKLYNPMGIFIDNDSQIYLADPFNQCVSRIDRNGALRRVIGTEGRAGYSGDVPYDFHRYLHIGPPKKPFIKSQAYHDLIIICSVEMDSFMKYQPATKKIKH